MTSSLTKIHPTAVISKEAELASDVEIGPFCVIGPHVKIGKGTRLSSHVVVDGVTQIGARCSIFQGACLGTPPQDKKFKDAVTHLLIGNDNIIREYVTINGGSSRESKTVVGDKNFVMINCHIGHDALLGNEITMANGTVIAGHAVIEDQAVLGGYAGVHQFARIGKLAMLGAFSKVVMDVPPFSLCDGYPAKVYGLNIVGLKRAGYLSKDLASLKRAFKILLASKSSLAGAIQKVKKEFNGQSDIHHLVHFIENSKRGVLRVSSKHEII